MQSAWMVKFATQVDEKVLKEIRALAKETDKSISKVVTEALAAHIQRARVRPAFEGAMEEMLNEHEEVLKRLAR